MIYEVTKTLQQSILTFWTLIREHCTAKSTCFSIFIYWNNNWLMVQQLVILLYSSSLRASTAKHLLVGGNCCLYQSADKI